MKIKAKTKKIIVLSVMVALLVTTGVLNFVLNDKLTAATENVGNVDGGGVTQTFFAAAKSEREATRESEYLYLDAIVNSENSSASAKTAAEKQKLELVARMDKELKIETLIKSKGFDDAIVTLGDKGASVVVGAAELTPAQANQICAIVVANTDFTSNVVKVLQYD